MTNTSHRSAVGDPMAHRRRRAGGDLDAPLLDVRKDLTVAAVRLAVVSDGDLIHELVRRSYSIYLDRLDRPPAPMLVDHTDRIRDKAVWVIGQPLAGIIVLTPTDHAMQIDNVAVDPDQQGRGLGRTLLAFAEELALRRGFSATELYTNEAMTENVALYRRLGYDEVDRRAEDGYRRVYMRKGLK